MESAALDASAYSEGEQFQREKRSLFARAWLPFCAIGQVTTPGDFVSHSLGGWPLFAVRGKDGVLRAFHNVCRHQQMPVIEKPTGRCDMLRCRYHGWTYDLTGALAVAPPMVAPPDPKSVRLGSIELVESAPLVFVRLEAGSDPAPSLDAQGHGMAATSAIDVACNWKTYIEALLPTSDWRLIWPIALHRTVDGITVVRQVVPRSFIRTRIVEFVFSGLMDDALKGRLAAASAADQAAAEALQERRAGGTVTADSAAVREFQARVISASA